MILDRIKRLEEMFYESALQTKNAIATDHKARQRVEHQNEGMFGLYLAICVDTQDPLKQGRIRIYTPLLNNNTTPIDGLMWANPISPLGGFDDCGAFWVPPAGSRVAIMFHGGNRQTPYYIGTIWERHRGKDLVSSSSTTSSSTGGQTTGTPASELALAASIFGGAAGGGGGGNTTTTTTNGTSSTSGADSTGDSHLDYWDGLTIPEYQCLWEGKRNGYNFGQNDGDEVLPQWNTECYNGYDIDSTETFYTDPLQYGSITYPNVRGIKSPEKHSWKVVDGDPKCNLRWKRMEFNSSCGNIIMMKDDHLHPCGQWAFGGNSTSDIAFCHDSSGDTPNENPCCDNEGNPKACEFMQCFGETSSSDDASDDCTDLTSEASSSLNADVKANPFYKRSEEMRFYDGAATPMNNKCELDQSGIQLQSISGHQLIMDDSVDQPTGVPTWDREFDFGCNDIYKGKTTWRSATGHEIVLDDSEKDRKLRGAGNGIFVKSAHGNKIILCDDTVREGADCDCPDNYAGRDRGIIMQSTSSHLFQMCDHGIRQCATPRVNDGEPALEDEHDYEGYILLRSGYGLQLLMKDQDIQTETKEQYIELLAPQKDNIERGPHQFIMQETQDGPGLIMLRAGGVYQQISYDDMVEVVGVEEVNPSSKTSQITDNYLIDVRNYYYNHNDLTMYFAEKYIFLLAGRDCEVPVNQAGAEVAAVESLTASNADLEGTDDQPDENGPCIFPIVVAQQAWTCPLTKFKHFGYIKDENGNIFDSRSERVFTSGKRKPRTTPPKPRDDSQISRYDYTTAGGNPPDGISGDNPAMLPDSVGQDPPASPNDSIFQPSNPGQAFPPVPD